MNNFQFWLLIAAIIILLAYCGTLAKKIDKLESMSGMLLAILSGGDNKKAEELIDKAFKDTLERSRDKR